MDEMKTKETTSPVDGSKVEDTSLTERSQENPKETEGKEEVVKDLKTSSPTTPSTNDAQIQATPSTSEETTSKTENIKKELSEFINFKGNYTRKRKKCDDDTDWDILWDVFLRTMYPLNVNMDKSVTVGVFKSLNFKPAVLINHCGKSSLVFTVEMWDRFTKFAPIIESYLFNNLSGRKTSIGFDNCDIEIDNIRLRGTQFVRFRDLASHNKKILLTLEEFQILSNLIPVIIRYIQQLNTYDPVIFDYLNASVNINPALPLIYGPVDPSIFNRLPQEVSFYRRCRFFFHKLRSEEEEETTMSKNNQKKLKEELKNGETSKTDDDASEELKNVDTSKTDDASA